MATYKGIKGFSIQNLSADPTDLLEGQMWYNSTSNVWKVEETTAAGAWATGANYPTGIANNAGAGYQNAALIFGGGTFGTPTAPGSTASNSYDGTSWSSTPSLNTARRYGMGTGTQTAAISMGGIFTAPVSATELYDGSTWTSNPTGLTRPSGLYDSSQAGTQAAAIIFGGEPASAATESWDGSVWTAANPIGTARWSMGGAGTQTAAIGFGGTLPPPTGATLLYDGTSWTTAGGTLNTARDGIDSAINGTQTSALAIGGATPPGVAGVYTESWDGTSWAVENTLSQSRVRSAGAGTQAAALSVGGDYPGGSTNATEEWTGAGALVTKTITTS